MTNGTRGPNGTSRDGIESRAIGAEEDVRDSADGVAPPTTPRARDLILSRRAKFMAAALAGIGAACGKEPSPPVMCLEPPYDPDAHAPTEQDAGDGQGPGRGDAGAPNVVVPPMVCLSVAYVEPDASVDAGGSGDASTPPDAGTPRPQPCLKIAPPNDPPAKDPSKPPPPPRPHPCLSPPMPRDPDPTKMPR